MIRSSFYIWMSCLLCNYIRTMSELIDVFVGVGELDGEPRKYGDLHVEHECLLNPVHPKHEEAVQAIGELALKADRNGGLSNTEAIWSYTLNRSTNEIVVENPYIKAIDYA